VSAVVAGRGFAVGVELDGLATRLAGGAQDLREARGLAPAPRGADRSARIASSVLDAVREGLASLLAEADRAVEVLATSAEAYQACDERAADTFSRAGAGAAAWR
jgi:hypothetical protein